MASSFKQAKVLSADADIEGPVKHLCEQKFGQGVCCSTLSDVEQRSLEAESKRLLDWCRLRRPTACNFDAKWDKLGLLYMGPRDAGPLAADALPPGVAILLLFAQLGPVACVVCWKNTFSPDVGDVIDFSLSMASIASEFWVARS